MKTIYHPTYRVLIQHLIDLRKIKGFTQMTLAQKLDKPQSYVAKIEGCERKLDVLEFIEICQALDVQASEMIKIIE
ncbi:helix-turn-helix domain-containing protein [Moraxella marmotae]|uniref:helix-turn-helix domain-containing protein n=1 Tax=Moraxella marmotae TaxID=3344520 RepID=UPI0035F4624A